MSTRLQVIQNWESLAKQANYRPSELASLCNTSLRTLERHFQKRYQMTVGQWLRTYRLNQAYNDLLTGKAVKEVCYEHAYKQVSHFSREFKNHFGTSPSMIQSPAADRRPPLSSWQATPAIPQMVYTF